MIKLFIIWPKCNLIDQSNENMIPIIKSRKTNVPGHHLLSFSDQILHKYFFIIIFKKDGCVKKHFRIIIFGWITRSNREFIGSYNWHSWYIHIPAIISKRQYIIIRIIFPLIRSSYSFTNNRRHPYPSIYFMSSFQNRTTENTTFIGTIDANFIFLRNFGCCGCVLV